MVEDVEDVDSCEQMTSAIIEDFRDTLHCWRKSLITRRNPPIALETLPGWTYLREVKS